MQMHMTIASSWNEIPWQCKEGVYAISEVGERIRFSNTACSPSYQNSMQELHADLQSIIKSLLVAMGMGIYLQQG